MSPHHPTASAFNFRSNDTLIDPDPTSDGEPTLVLADDYRFELFRRTLRPSQNTPSTTHPVFVSSGHSKGILPMQAAQSSFVASETLRAPDGEANLRGEGGAGKSRVLRLRDLAYVPYLLLAMPNGLALAALFSSVLYGMNRKSNPLDAKLINRHGWRAFFIGLAMQTAGAVLAIYYPELFQK